MRSRWLRRGLAGATLLALVAGGTALLFWPTIEARLGATALDRLTAARGILLEHHGLERIDPGTLRLRSPRLEHARFTLTCAAIDASLPTGLAGISVLRAQRLERAVARDCDLTLHTGTRHAARGTAIPLEAREPRPWSRAMERLARVVDTAEIEELRIHPGDRFPEAHADVPSITFRTDGSPALRGTATLHHPRLPQGVALSVHVAETLAVHWDATTLASPIGPVHVEAGDATIHDLNRATADTVVTTFHTAGRAFRLAVGPLTFDREAGMLQIRSWRLRAWRPQPAVQLLPRRVTAPDDGRVRARTRELSSVGLPGSPRMRARHARLEDSAHTAFTRARELLARPLPDLAGAALPFAVRMDTGVIHGLLPWAITLPRVELLPNGNARVDVDTEGVTLSVRTTLQDPRTLELAVDRLRWSPRWGESHIDTTLRLGGVVSIDPSGIRLQARLEVRDTTLVLPAVADDTITPVDATQEITATLDLATPGAESMELALEGTVNTLPTQLRVALHRADGLVALRIEGGFREAYGCQDTWRAIPAALLPVLGHDGLRFRGTFQPELSFAMTLGDADTAEVTATGLPGDCEVASIRRAFDPERLNAPDFVHHVQEGTSLDDLFVGPGTDSFVPIIVLPSYVPAVMYLSEEIAFFRNPGVSLSLLNRALRMNLDYGRYIYGGSTVTQQLVKNLFLSRTKTLSRKLEELVLTWLVEKHVSKERILELYLNCIEFGPDVYGIGHAAQHYFGKPAWELTPLEAAYLAALKPSPRVGETWRRRGSTPERGYFPERLRELLHRLHRFGGHIHPDEVDHYAPWIVRFPTELDPPLESQTDPTDPPIDDDAPRPRTRRRPDIPRPPGARVRLFDAEVEADFRPGPVLRREGSAQTP